LEIPQVVHDYIDAFARADVDGCGRAFAERHLQRPGNSGPLSGQALRDHFAAFFGGFPDARCELVSLGPVTGTCRYGCGSYRARTPAPTWGIPGNRPVTDSAWLRIPRRPRRQAAPGRLLFDRLTILAQLGLAPDPVAPPRVSSSGAPAASPVAWPPGPLSAEDAAAGSGIRPSSTQAKGRFRDRSRPFLILVQQQNAAAGHQVSPVAELAERVAGGVGRGLRLDLLRHSNLAVPKNAHGHTRVEIEAASSEA
jgi:hypothetical protein